MDPLEGATWIPPEVFAISSGFRRDPAGWLPIWRLPRLNFIFTPIASVFKKKNPNFHFNWFLYSFDYHHLMNSRCVNITWVSLKEVNSKKEAPNNQFISNNKSRSPAIKHSANCRPFCGASFLFPSYLLFLKRKQVVAGSNFVVWYARHSFVCSG